MSRSGRAASGASGREASVRAPGPGRACRRKRGGRNGMQNSRSAYAEPVVGAAAACLDAPRPAPAAIEMSPKHSPAAGRPEHDTDRPAPRSLTRACGRKRSSGRWRGLLTARGPSRSSASGRRSSTTLRRRLLDRAESVSSTRSWLLQCGLSEHLDVVGPQTPACPQMRSCRVDCCVAPTPAVWPTELTLLLFG